MPEPMVLSLMKVVIMPWKRFWVPSVMMKAGRRSQWTSSALHRPRAMPISVETMKGKAMLLIPVCIISSVLT